MYFAGLYYHVCYRFSYTLCSLNGFQTSQNYIFLFYTLKCKAVLFILPHEAGQEPVCAHYWKDECGGKARGCCLQKWSLLSHTNDTNTGGDNYCHFN